MGIDLTLLPVMFEGQKPWLLHNRVFLNRDYDLQALFNQIEGQFVPGGTVLYYDDEGIKERTTDPYGDTLKWVQAGQIAKIKFSNVISQWNKAAVAWISTLDPSTPVVLWWH